MGFKNSDRCLDKVADDEPIFVLRAQDANAVEAIQHWWSMSRESLTDEHKNEVSDCIVRFEQWQAAHPDRVKAPD